MKLSVPVDTLFPLIFRSVLASATLFLLCFVGCGSLGHPSGPFSEFIGNADFSDYDAFSLETVTLVDPNFRRLAEDMALTTEGALREALERKGYQFGKNGSEDFVVTATWSEVLSAADQSLDDPVDSLALGVGYRLIIEVSDASEVKPFWRSSSQQEIARSAATQVIVAAEVKRLILPFPDRK